jgi:CBS domain containing-hemolysin-like protein
VSDADLLALLLVLLCLGCSAFFSSSEIAITSYGEHAMRKLLEEGGKPARTVETWVRHPVRVLSTILVANNLVNTVVGSLTTALALRHLGGGEYSEWAVPIAIFFATVLVIVFGEIVPKAVGKHYSQRLALPMLTVLNVVGRVLAPATWLLTRLTDFVLRRAQTEQQPVTVTTDDLDYLVKVGQREGSIHAEQAALLRGVFRFDDRIVRDIMVPRDRVTAVDLNWDVERVLEVAQASGHSRLPAYEDTLDQVKGVLHIKQLLGREKPAREILSKIMRAPMFVSESLHISDLLQNFKERRVHLAIVVDDGGHTVGVVTLEDVLEQIVGQIFDETDVTPVGIVMDNALGVHYLDGQASLRRVEELLKIELEEIEAVHSVGDLLTQLAGQMPIAGSVFVYENVRFKVLAANEKRVIRVAVEMVDVDHGGEK